MSTTLFEIPDEVSMKRRMADGLRQRANEIEQEADTMLERHIQRFMRKVNDRMLNRTECLEYLPIGTLESLKNWENKYRPYGYLQFENNKMSRNSLLAFIDDLNSGKIHRQLKRNKTHV